MCSSDLGAGQTGTTLVADAQADGGGAGSSDSAASDGSASDGAANDGQVASADAPSADAANVKYATCSSALNCARIACTAEVPTGCAQPCVTSAAPAAQAGLQAFLDCVETTCKANVCPPGSPPGCLGACVLSRCSLKAAKCASDGQVGTASCDAAFACFEKCKSAPDWGCRDRKSTRLNSSH